MFKHLSGNEFAIGYFNFAPKHGEVLFTFADAGIPYGSGVALEMTDAITGESLGLQRDYYNLIVPAHGCRIILAKMVK
jgi:alpha-galactosidase